ncbi:acyltransferase family protein [Brachybacterium massiliense]|uniref:acyltransferase family protein n=1 Tax=Brachybacterium massiliense TaxID=1755098 RepID=UPI001FE930E1|nr:acyltransferase family protein [Brachybacterium massiliense]
MTAPAVHGPHAARTAPAKSPGFRPDIQGLRAIAVMLVLLYHSGVSALSGGFVGVDVFFVISGFLITTHLLEALEREGRIRFGAFYAKRARRILPAALLVALLSMLAAWIWMSPLLMPEVLRGAVATALYVPNYFFAQQGTNYLAESTPSVFQHYWSLGIEEQFYLFWPLLLAAGFWVCRRSERRLMLGAAALTAASFLACVLLMDVSQPWTFFSLPTRAWELGAGALVAFLLRSGARWLRSKRTGLLAWAGLVVLALVVVTFDEGTAFPGWSAALPVLATAAMLVGGAAPGELHAGRVLGLAPMQFLGTISYSLYLVHWPLQVIPQAASLSEEPLPLWIRLLLGAVAVPLAWLLHRLVERPVLRWPSLRRGPSWRTGALAAAASLELIATSAGISQVLPQQTSSDRTAAQEQPSLAPTGTDFVPANLSPTLETVSGDNPSIYAAGCHQEGEAADASGCRAGENPDAPLVFLVGDSHAANWYPALERLAEEGRIRLDSSTKSSCLPLETPQQFEDRPFDSCDRWRGDVLERIAEVEPDLVVLAAFHDPDRLMPGGQDSPETRWREGLARTLARIDGPPVAVMRDVPTQAQAPTHCLAQNPESAGRCATPRADAFEVPLVQAEADAIAESDADAHHVDLTGYFCNEASCPVLLGNTVIYRDQHHLTQTFSREMAEPLWEEIEPLVV